MKIEILSDVVSYQPAIIGWRNSRDQDSDVSRLPLIDTPVNEFPTVFLSFENFTILEREIFTSARNHVIWARGSRVDDPLKFCVPEEFSLSDLNLRSLNEMTARKDAGEQQDQWRMHLPLVSLTSWSARMSYREVVRWSKYFDHLTTKSHYLLRKRFRKIAERFRQIAIMFVGDMADEAIEIFKLVKFLDEADDHDAHIRYVARSRISQMIPMALRAQIVRHREITFIDGLFDMLCSENFRSFNLSTPIFFAANATDETWRSVIGKRACWISQAELWQPIVSNFETIGCLPCSDGYCPYETDAHARLTDADPGAPCPRFCNLNGISKIPFKLKMQLEASVRGAKPGSYWDQEINA
jgi:hypothetical protein